MQQWEAHGMAVRESYHALHFELESQRATRHTELCAALRESPGRKVDLDDWIRLVNYKYSNYPLSPAGSIIWSGGRFNIGSATDPTRFTPFPALYLAVDFMTAFCEYHQLKPSETRNGLTAHELALQKPGSWASLRLKGHVNNVFDFTRQSSVAAFCKIISRFTLSARVTELEDKAGIEHSKLIRDPKDLIRSLTHENWHEKTALFDLPANSQVFGKLLVDSGFEGILYRSSKTTKKCLAVFTRQLAGSDTVIRLADDPPEGAGPRELNASNCNSW